MIRIGAFLPGTAAVVMTNVRGGHHLQHHLPLLAVERLIHRRGIATGPLARLGLQIQLDELGAEGAHLLGHRRADVVSVHDGAEPAGGGDGLQSGDAGAHHEHPCRGHRACRGHQHREHLRQALGSQQDRLVAGDGGHGGQGIHALRTGDAWDQLHGEQVDPAIGERLGGRGLAQRLGHPDDGLALVQQLQIGGPVLEVGAEGSHLEHHLS